jgi:hypothetical protein
VVPERVENARHHARRGRREVEWKGDAHHGSARVRDVVEKFRAKYGADEVAKYYSTFDGAVAVPLA